MNRGGRKWERPGPRWLLAAGRWTDADPAASLTLRPKRGAASPPAPAVAGGSDTPVLLD